MTLLLLNIHQLHCVANRGELKKSGFEMADSSMIENAYVYVENGLIRSVGRMDHITSTFQEADEIIDCEDRLVLPGFVDSHTHLVFAKGRETEYVDRIKGLKGRRHCRPRRWHFEQCQAPPRNVGGAIAGICGGTCLGNPGLGVRRRSRSKAATA